MLIETPCKPYCRFVTLTCFDCDKPFPVELFREGRFDPSAIAAACRFDRPRCGDCDSKRNAVLQRYIDAR